MTSTPEKPGPVTTAAHLLRHAVATLAYRSAKVLRNAPEAFGEYRASEGSRTPVEILAHMSDLLDWALSLAEGAPEWHDTPPTDWRTECQRYFAALAALDERLGSAEELGRGAERIFQAPIADALAHTGQLALLRRQVGSPVRGENYYVASITAGQVGPDQPPPRIEFDGKPAGSKS